MEKAYAFVHIIDIAYGIDIEYSYFLPPEMRNEVSVGSVIVVPFGNSNKRVSAVIVGFSDACEYPRVKPADSVMRYPFDIPEELIRTCLFMKERFFCTFGNAFKTVLPPGVNFGTETTYSLIKKADTSKLNPASEILCREIKLKEKMTEKEIIGLFGDECKRLLASLCREGILEKSTLVREKLNEKNLFTVSLTVSAEEAEALAEDGNGLTKKQCDLLAFLTHYPAATMRELEELGGFSAAIVAALVKKGLAEKRETAVLREAYDFGNCIEKPFTLSDEQKEALEGIDALALSEEPKAALLFGVTGSGKTRVIIEEVKRVISRGKRAIVLLPEIGLTSQALLSYAAAFGEKLSVVHSMLSVGERTDAFKKIQSGEIDVVLGTRSAVFAPLTDIGIIVIDEEQAATYKSELSPKYNAVDIARFRCSRTGALMLLASATPSVESFYKAKKGIYSLFRLTERFGGTELPEVIIEDLRGDETIRTDKLIGTRLAEEIRQTHEEGLQCILFVNRRGYNSHISCRDCGYVYVCPNCSVSMTYHAYSGGAKSAKRLSCHYCGYTRPLPERCDICGHSHIGYFGFGTQKLQDELERDFPDIKATRMDSDTTSGKLSHTKILEDFGNGEYEILFGTQMISKGLDFPKVRLAGAISVDSSLYMNDFRAGERTFSLITQLVGRAGRAGKRGLAVLQSYNPDNETLKLAMTQDYEKFFESEIKLRRAVVFPPFCSVAVFGFSSASEEECAGFARKFDALLLSLYDSEYKDLKIIRYGPFPNGIYKILGKFRQRIIIKYKDSARAREFFSELLSKGLATAPKNLKLDLDVNPSII